MAAVASLFAIGLLLDSWLTIFSGRTNIPNIIDVGVGASLAIAVAAAHKFPIHLRPHTKIQMNSVPLYLIVVLLPMPIALLTIGAGTLAGQLWIRKERGSVVTDIAMGAARWVIVGFFAAQVAHLPSANVLTANLILFVTACVLFVGDMLTASLHIALMGTDSYARVLIANLHEATVIEALQYLIGILGALAAAQQVWSLVLLALPIAFAYFAFKSTKEVRDITRRMLESMADAIDLRDPYTGGHSRRLVGLIKGTMRELGIAGPEVDLICAAARLHDIGKIGVPDRVLQKPAPLALAEWQVMHSHPERGAELLSRYPDFARGADFIRYHHERWDGTGYPRGLKGTEIPLGARVIAVVDAFDAMTSDRPYRPAMSVERAAWELRAGRGKQWDPRVVDAFLRVVAKQFQCPQIIESAEEKTVSVLVSAAD